MDYEALRQDDLANVRALNAGWLDLVPPFGLEAERIARQRARLAETPFLLFSLRETDDRFWVRLLDGRRQPDLLATPPGSIDRKLALQATSLAFLWELSRRNPYVARLVGIAPLAWCELIASVTLVHLLEAAAGVAIIESRFAEGSRQYRRLLQLGGSARRETRRAAQIAAMQSLLTEGDIAEYGRQAAAACRMAGPARQVTGDV